MHSRVSVDTGGRVRVVTGALETVFAPGQAAAQIALLHECILQWQAEVERLRRERDHFARVAEWFYENPPGAPVPAWCVLARTAGKAVVEDDVLTASEQAAEGGKNSAKECEAGG